MRRISCAVMGAGLALAVAVSNFCSVAGDGKRLEELRNSVLRLHVLANSDSKADQQLKLCVRDAVLEHGNEIFRDCSDAVEAEKAACENLEYIEGIARETLAGYGCTAQVAVKLEDTYFDERTYGDITMPAGEYTALRIEIGEAKGKNWWCVMYPPLCLPAACSQEVEDNKAAEEQFFSEEQQDIIYNPQKYRVRFALWDKFRSWTDKWFVKNDENSERY